MKPHIVITLICITLIITSLGKNNSDVVPSMSEQQKRAATCIELAARGDALGRVTEFKKTMSEIYAAYPNGVQSPRDFSKWDWNGVPHHLIGETIAPYTDDTAMALLVLRVLQPNKTSPDLNSTMENLAALFIQDFNTKNGWAEPFRAPGNACIAGVKTLAKNNLNQNQWWDVQAHQAGGCGAVMRAHPFGIAFAHDPQQAALYAAQHSKLTHGHPMSLAASAALATGIALLISKTHATTLESITQAMVKSANLYDAHAALLLEQAQSFAKISRDIIQEQKITTVTDLHTALKNPLNPLRIHHDKVFDTFQGWRADEALAGALYVFLLFPTDPHMALYTAVHTIGDSDSLASIAGALVGAYTGSAGIWDWKVEKQDELTELAKKLIF